MRRFNWNQENNLKLIKERGISFEQIINSIQNDAILDILEHKNQTKYPGQKVFVVRFLDYAYLIPFIESEEEYFLKTIIPSRKATREYLMKDQ